MASVCARRAGRDSTVPKWTAMPCSVYPIAPIRAPSVSNCTNASAPRAGPARTVPNRLVESTAADTVDARPARASATPDGPENSAMNVFAIRGTTELKV